MASELLRQARSYEEKNRPLVKQQLPLFHLTGGVGWINDPNGFAPYRGEYHLFFQYYPYDVKWGPMHWGHAKTKDFIRWELLPAALAPDAEYDREGCFSGGAVELPDGRHMLMYTGVQKQAQEDGTFQIRQTQCVAFGDGVDYEKSPLDPVISGADLPEGGSPVDFRDPKSWREGDTFYSVIVDRGPDGSGTVLLYESKDGLNWKLDGNLAQCHYRYGKMWECPDLFTLDGKDVLIHSAQDMRPEGLEYHAGNGKVCHVGRLDRENWKFADENIHAMEYGLDFYAPQTLETEDGRRVLVGWMQSWESSGQTREGLGFMGQMTIPRELRVRNGRVCQMPVRELERYRRNPVKYRNVRVTGDTVLPGVQGRFVDLLLEIRQEPGETCREFTLEIAKNDDYFTTITLHPQEGTITLDRAYSGFNRDIVNQRTFPASLSGETIRFRLILDRYSAELFVGEGEQAASMVLYTPLEADGISMRADAAALVDVEKYEIVVD